MTCLRVAGKGGGGPPLCLLTAVLLLGAGTAGAQDSGASRPPAATAPAPAAPADKSLDGLRPLDLDLDKVQRGGDSVADGVASAWAMMVKALVGLAVTLLAIYVVLGKGLARFMTKSSLGKSITVVDRLGLDARRTLYLVDVDGVRTLVGTVENTITMTVLPPRTEAAKDFRDELRRTAETATPADGGKGDA